MIITIARQCGSGGHEIGKELASRLGLEKQRIFPGKGSKQPALQHCCKLRRKQSDGKIF